MGDNRFPAITEVVPHRPPMLLIEALEHESEGSLTCSARPRSTTPYSTAGKVPSILCLEYMAQAVAAYAGLRALRENDQVRMGYIIGVRSMTLEVPFLSTGNQVLITVRHIWGDDSLGKFDCSITLAGRQIAHADLSAFQGDLGPEQ